MEVSHSFWNTTGLKNTDCSPSYSRDAKMIVAASSRVHGLVFSIFWTASAWRVFRENYPPRAAFEKNPPT